MPTKSVGGKKSTGPLAKITPLAYIFTESRLKLSTLVSEARLAQIVIPPWKKIKSNMYATRQPAAQCS